MFKVSLFILDVYTIVDHLVILLLAKNVIKYVKNLSHSKFMVISTSDKDRNWIKKVMRNLNEASDLVMAGMGVGNQRNKKALKQWEDNER